MISTRMDGKALAKKVKRSVGEKADGFFEAFGRKPKLAVIHAGDNAASAVYVRNKEKACIKNGFEFFLIRKPESARFEDIRQSIEQCNSDSTCDGILVQLPLPGEMDETALLHLVRPDKDVDCFHPYNVGRLWGGTGGLAPCTPAGIMRLLQEYEIDLCGKSAVIIGRSNIVGKPMAALLLKQHATVTITHSRTRNLDILSRDADILVAAIGRPGFIPASSIKPGAVVIDVGINRIEAAQAAPRWLDPHTEIGKKLQEKGSTLVGDIDPIGLEAIASFYTPVPGGVGPMTIAMLLENTLKLALARMKG